MRNSPGTGIGAVTENMIMNTLTDLIDRYITTWNETDAG